MTPIDLPIASSELKKGTKTRRARKLLPAFLAVGVVLVGVSAGAYRNWKVAHALVASSSASLTGDSQEIDATVPGTVSQVFVKPGDAVHAGQVLAVLENRSLMDEEAKAETDLAAAQKKVNETQAAIVPPPIEGTLRPYGGPPLPAIRSRLPALEPPPVETAPPAQPVIPKKPAPRPQKANVPTQPVAPEIHPALGGPPDTEPALQSPPPPRPPTAVAAPPAGNPPPQTPPNRVGPIIRSSNPAVASKQAALDGAELAIQTTQDELNEATEHAQAAQQPLETLQSTLALAKTQRDKFQGLYNDGIISRREFQKKQQDVDDAQAAVDQAQKAIADAESRVDAQKAQLATAERAAYVANQQLQGATKQAANAPPVQAPPAPSEEVPPRPMFRLPRHVSIPVMPPPLGSFPPPAGGLKPVGVEFSPPAHESAAATLVAATQALQRIQHLADGLKIVASADGEVSSVRLQPGQAIGTPTPAVTIVRPKSLHILAQFPLRSALRIKPGMPCEVEFQASPRRGLPGALTLPGRVVRFVTPSTVEVGIIGSMDRLATVPVGATSVVRVQTISD